MKIINIILTSQNGGAEQVFIDYLIVLKNLGHEVLAVVKQDAPYADKISSLGIAVKKISNRFGEHDIFAVKELQKILQDFSPMSVIAHVGRSVVLSKKAIKKFPNHKIFLIAVNHSNNVKRSIGADLIFSVNSTIFAQTIDAGQSEDSSFVIPNAIDTADIESNHFDVDLSKKNQINIGALGRFDRTKGFDVLIKAIDYLNKISQENKSGRTFKLLLAGSGYYEKNLTDLVKDLNLQDKVIFKKWINDKKSFFSEFDIFCLPSKNETFGLVLLEAMKYRKPIVASNSEGPKEIISDNKDGLIFDFYPEDKNHENLANKIIKLIEDRSLANQLVNNANRKLINRYSLTSLELRLKEIFGPTNSKVNATSA